MDVYRILGARNPNMAWEAITMKPCVGAMLPCNVILHQVGGAAEVSTVDPASSMQAIPNDDLKSVAGQMRGLLQEVVEAV